jgi:hypothetical protein
MQREEQVSCGGQRPVLNLTAENCHIFFRRRCCSAPLVQKAANALRMAQGLELLVFLAEEEAAEEEEEEEGGCCCGRCGVEGGHVVTHGEPLWCNCRAALLPLSGSFLVGGWLSSRCRLDDDSLKIARGLLVVMMPACRGEGGRGGVLRHNRKRLDNKLCRAVLLQV